jgi:hypothetical protein
VHQRLAEEGVLGDYHLLLAHQVLDQPAIHKAFYRDILPTITNGRERASKSVKALKRPYIIMDNSLIELGEPLSVREVLAAGEIVDARVIVLPDVLGDRIETLNRTMEAMEDLHGLRRLSPYAKQVKALGVAQGRTFTDVFSCARDMIQILGVDIISVPRHVTATLGTRLDVTRAISRYGKPIHLLGFSDNIFDDMYTLAVDRVMGIDSAVPIWYGLQGFELPSSPPVVATFGKRPKDYEDATEINSQVVNNIRRVERWANIARSAPTGK